jgi:hypothetical protein
MVEGMKRRSTVSSLRYEIMSRSRRNDIYGAGGRSDLSRVGLPGLFILSHIAVAGDMQTARFSGLNERGGGGFKWLTQ